MSQNPEALIRNPVVDRLAADETVVFMQVRLVESIEIAQIARTAGFDGFYIDLEHCPMSLRDAGQICMAALAIGVAPYVRVPNHGPEFIARALDAGALGVFVPHVETAADAQRIAAMCRYPPFGTRSGSSALPHLKYRKVDIVSSRRDMDAATQIVVMIESARAVENVEEIAAVEGIDVLHIGTADLCADLGLEGQPNHPTIRAIYERVISACRRNGRHVGVGGMANNPELRAEMVEMGARLVITGSDHAFLLAEATRRCRQGRGL